MERYGLECADYGRLVRTQRGWAARNENALYRKPLTLDEYLSAPFVSDPLCIYDCVPVVAGADALVLVAGTDGVRFRALAALHNHDRHEGDGLQTGLASVASALWDEARVAPDDVDVLSGYDDYPVMVLVQLTDLGYGEPARILEGIESGRLAINTSGGQLSAGQAGAAGGMHGVVEVSASCGAERAPVRSTGRGSGS